MATDVMMPRLSDSMEEGTVLKWLVDQGGEVKRGEPLVEIETDKANMVYDADTDGVLVEVLGKEGDTFPVGEVIARIGDVGDSSEQIAVGRPEPEAAPERESAPEPQPSPPPPSRESGGNGGDPERIKASPVARRMAREMGVELAALSGSGPGGRIVKADVEAAAGDGAQALKPKAKSEKPEEAGAARAEVRESGAKGDAEVVELTRLQQTVSR